MSLNASNWWNVAALISPDEKGTSAMLRDKNNKPLIKP
jgi:hypothetical protein